MLESGLGADFTIECEGREFRVHKFVLMAHSEVFRAMLSHEGCKEVRESRVQLVDTNPTAVGHMLTYLYSGGMAEEEFVDDDAPALIEISEKYALDPLKSLCQSKLISR
jgi:speckle-type POZ protein